MEGGLPFLPGNRFSDPTMTAFHRSHSLGYRNGYALQNNPTVGIGGKPLQFNQISQAELDELASYTPGLTYGQAKQASPAAFVPAHVVWDKKVLRFHAWFQESVTESPLEHYRVRPVTILYYLEDDSMAVIEVTTENSGMPQGKLLRRQRLPKNDVGDFWNWKDLNVGMNVTFYGKVFHIYDCDGWSRDFMESEGLVVNPSEQRPADPYTESRRARSALTVTTKKTPSDLDKLRQFLEMDKKVLRFYATWDDRRNMFGELRKFEIHYYLANDTLEVREVHSPNDGRDPFPVLINRHRVPKDRYDVDPTFPNITLELSDQEMRQHFHPQDFGIGKSVNIYQRDFNIYDMDDFTKAYYWKNFGVTDFTPAPTGERQRGGGGGGGYAPQMEIPSSTGFGSLDDSMQSCLSLNPKPPKKDLCKMMENDGLVLRFEAILDSMRPEDKGRRFIISYRLADDMITIHEPPVRNSGIVGGKFLERSRVAKPGSNPNQPVYYGPQDFYVGAEVEILKRPFIITNADVFVLRYMEEHRSQFPDHVIRSLQEKLNSSGPVRLSSAGSGSGTFQRSFGAGGVDAVYREVRNQLKKLALTDSNRKDRIYLGIDLDRQNCITKEHLRQVCVKHNLPSDDEIIDRIAADINPNNRDAISLEDLREFFEN